MALPLALPILQRRRELPSLGCACRQGFRLEARHVLILLAASAVAVWWLAARQRKERQASRFGLRPADCGRRPGEAPIRLPGGVPEERATPGPSPPARTARGAAGDLERSSAHAARQPARTARPAASDGLPDSASPTRAPTACAPRLPGPLGPASLPLFEAAGAGWPWVQRAALSIRLGRPAELRRIAEDMERAGLDIEAGLLANYALLLEASQASRPRVLAEVTRLLQAAAGHRQNAPFNPRRRPPGARPERSRPRIPMPTLPVERRRRAGR